VSGRNVTLSATASDTGSGISKVEFYVDNVLRGTDTSSPYTASWQLRKVPKGAHSIKVRAFDGAGNVAEAVSSVTVN
jgi:pyridoxal biosynthesis lyase PdxS